jgi:glycine/D-amino acid oxidase-like deaminating enzyme
VVPWPTSAPTAADRAAYADAEPRSYWLADLPAREPAAALAGDTDADLCVVGGGFTGLWAALQAKEEQPGRDVVLLEAATAGASASGRSGGFVSASLTHGVGNGLARWPRELPALERLGRDNLAGLRADVERLGIACELEETGELTVALEPERCAALAEEVALLRRFGREVELFDGPDAMQAEVASPTYRGGLWDRSAGGVLHPGRLADGLLAAALRTGVRVYEGTPATGLEGTSGDAVVMATRAGRVRARRVLLATSAHPPLLGHLRRYVAPVYDYVLVTQPLDRARREAIGWRRRQGIADAANQFHYYRLTHDDRILWGGYDAVYRYGGRVHPRHDERDATFARLSQHFFTTFPQLEGVRFTHRWGGAIDTCSRFAVFFGTAFGGRVAYATGYTGLGVGASRWGARVALDLLDARRSEAVRLEFVRRKPMPFPPEPLRWAVIQATRAGLAAADRRGGRRGAWLRLLDRLGLGFDS